MTTAPMSFRDLRNFDDATTKSWGQSRTIRPLWAGIQDTSLGIGEERNKKLVDLLNQEINALIEWREMVTRVQRLNTLLYKGKHYFSQDDFYRLPYNKNKRYSKNHAKVVVNYLRQVTESHVADMTAYEPNLEVMPSKDEESAKTAAKDNKDLLDYYFYEEKLNTAFQTFHRRKKVHGETFKFVLWNENKGDLHPAYKQYRDMQQQSGNDPDAPIPIVDPTSGQQLKGDDGQPLFMSKVIRQGDIQIEDEYSWNVLYPIPPSALWSEVDRVHRLKWLDVDVARIKWPQYAEKIKTDGNFDRYVGYTPSLSNKVCVRYTYYPPNEMLPYGWYCVSTQVVILEEGPYPFKHNRLPCIRGTDVDVPGEIHGMSFYQDLVTLQQAINSSTSMILQNQSLYSYPKLLAPRGARLKWQEFDDDRGYYEYSGVQKPELFVPNSTPQDTWKWRDAMRDEFKTLSAVFATSNGRAPDGITANVALRMIDEQERKLHKPSIDKHADNVVELGTLILGTVGTFRDPSDGALIKIFGKNSQRKLRYFDVTKIWLASEVKLAKSSGLPQSPAARTQMVIDLNTSFPGMFSNEEVLEMLDMKRPEGLIDSAIASRQAAESEMEDLLQGMPVPPPTQYHDILPRYEVYAKTVQSRQFDEIQPQIKQAVLTHIITAEYLIAEKIRVSPTFGALVAQKFPNFPMFFPMPQSQGIPFQLASSQPMGMMNQPPIGGVSPEQASAAAPIPMPQQAIPPQGNIPVNGPLPQPNVPAEGNLP
jgi:hypothetical protein